MRRPIMTVALAGGMLAACAMPAAAQQNGVVIQNNGVDSADSAAGSDNVRISNNPGNGQSLSGGGVNNDTGTVVKERDRKDRSARNNAEAAPAEEYAAPADEYVAPAEDYQAYTDPGEYVEPVAAPEQTAVDATGQDQQVLKLPSTGVGNLSSLPLAAAAAAGFIASALGTLDLRRRQTS